MADLSQFPVSFVGGLNDAKAIEEPQDFQRLENLTRFRGRITLRAPFLSTAQLLDDQPTPQPVTSVLAIQGTVSDLYVVSHSTTTSKVYLHRLNTDGTSPSLNGVVWSSVASPPRVVVTYMTGGSASTGVQRLYIADYSSSLPTVYYVEGVGFTTVQEDLDNDGTKETLKFSIVYPFMFHLFGVGHYLGSVWRPEVLRFSRPGLIAEDSGSGLATEPREWWTEDYRPIGARGERITCLSSAGLSLIIFKRRETYAFYGFDALSWQVRQLSPELGAVGPYAAAAVEGECYFWSERGPAVTDGQSVRDISEPVRAHVLESATSDVHVVGFSPDDGIVYFFYPTKDSALPNRYLAYHVGSKLFVGEGDLPIAVRSANVSRITTQPGPAAAPTGLAVVRSASSPHSTLELSWTNGDTSLETKTSIERDGVEIARVPSGVSSYSDGGRSPITTYSYKVRHERNNQFSAYSGPVSSKTALPPPSNFRTNSVVGGIRVTFDNNISGANIRIQRRNVGGQFVDLVVLTNQLVGTITYDDTTAVFGTAYEYRARTEKLGEVDSIYTEPSSSVAGYSAAVTSVSHTERYSTINTTVFRVSWTLSGTLEPGAYLRIERDFNSGGFVEVGTSVGFNFDDEITGWVLDTSASPIPLRYRVSVIVNGFVVSSVTELAVNHNMRQETQL